MPYALNFYHDQIGAGGASAQALPAAHRLLYVRHGATVVNGKAVGADEALYCEEPVAFASAGAWSEVWRWELALPNAVLLLVQGNGVLSHLRMARVITSLAIAEGTRWLLRLDRIVTPAGRIADRHQHPLEGTFNVQQDAESARDLRPGDAWWETGSDTVIAWSSPQMAAKFLRGMVLPVEWEGKVTGTWLSGRPPPPGNWKLYVDRVIAL